MMVVVDIDSTYITEYIKIETNKRYERFCDEITSIIFEKETIFTIPQFSAKYTGKEFKTSITNYDFTILCSEKYCYIACRFYNNEYRHKLFSEKPRAIIESTVLNYDTTCPPDSKIVHKTDSSGITYAICTDSKDNYLYISVLNSDIEEFDISVNEIKFNYDPYLGKYFSDKKGLPGYTITFEENSTKRLSKRFDISLHVKLQEQPKLKIEL